MDTFIVTSAVDYSNGTARIGKCTIDDKTSLKQAELHEKGIRNMARGRERKYNGNKNS